MRDRSAGETEGTAIRRRLVDALWADCVGPFAGRGETETAVEVLELAPSRWYLTGFLAPRDDRELADPTAEEEIEAGSDLDDVESAGSEPEPKQRKQFPASLGMSVLLPSGSGDSIGVAIGWAEYVKQDFEREGEDKPIKAWHRVPRQGVKVTMPLDATALAKGIPVPEAVGVRLRGKLETVVGGESQGLAAGTRALSLFVVNERRQGERGRRDEQFLFQVEMALEFAGGIVARPNRQGRTGSWDERVGDLHFRDQREYAVGHNVAVELPPDQRAAARAGEPVTCVCTTWMPATEVYKVRAPAVDGVTISMNALAALDSAAAVEEALGELPRAYRRWIEAQRALELDDPDQRATLSRLADNAERACARIEAGIGLVAGDERVRRAFCLANRAMADAARRRRPDPAWRLFQLAFILQCLPETADPAHDLRDRVELIYFPTGGGKTEAYLGLIAFTLFWRRMQGRERPDGGLGVAVILRYTLRLLTLDQLGRAATLICAMERIRREIPEMLGDVRFSVGLWVGRSATANTMAEVAEKARLFRAGQGDTPFPLTSCPWCGDEIKASNINTRGESVVVSCGNFKACDFSSRRSRDGLPVLFVDEQIYRELPSFVVATVDKFALMPWRGEIGALFGRVTSRDGGLFFGPMDGPGTNNDARPQKLPDGLYPPELIVQDELHLISGPLGTMVGLYETAIETLCTRGSIRPKIVASTATVRRAAAQIRHLFGRGSSVFPPPGPNDADTFFSEKSPEPGRLYVGLAAPGRSMKSILLRAYVDLGCAAAQANQQQPEIADAYMTLAGYFNSLRELGGMRRLVEDDVRTLAAVKDQRKPLDWIGPSPHFVGREIHEPLELTSREKTGRIKDTKAKLEQPFADTGTTDVILASNMISVGIDIDRLGLMVVAGQPKTTSEYIQASSRVGRQAQWPGLVVTAFNLVKPRDRSHFERFDFYHRTFYRQVEVQSLTPFATPALERGLLGTLLSMARLLYPEMTPPLAAMKLIEHRARIEAGVLVPLSERIERVGGDADAERAARRVAARVRSLLDSWQVLVESALEGGKRRYSPYDRLKEGKPILRTVLEDDPDAGSDARKFVAPTSMRDVEPSVHLWTRHAALEGPN